MSLTRLFPVLTAAALAVGVTAPPAQAQGTGIVITSIDLEGLDYDPVAGLLTATGGTVEGTFAGLPFTTDVENFALQLLADAEDGACSVLNLELAPINLNVLGLFVNTSPICLELTAFAGEGLLGDLLCGLAGGDALLLPDLLAALPEILTESLAQETNEDADLNGDICEGDCVVLHLSLGPVDLTLLGLNVYLHDCDDGPVQVCVSASEGQGLLGDLLCGLLFRGSLIDLGDLLGLLEAIGDIPGIEDLNLNRGQTNSLVVQLRNALRDGSLTDGEINQLVRRISNFIR